MALLHFLANEVRKTTKNPRRASALFSRSAWGRLWHRLMIGLNPRAISGHWDSRIDGITSMKMRRYRSYEQYLDHQREKLAYLDLGAYDTHFHAVLLERARRLIDAGMLQRGDRVLCLAARIGTEVRAFIDAGCFAVGIDLNPGKDNRYVVMGDFHALQYSEGTLDAVFTNSLDHAFDVEKIIAEARRVLRDGGHFILEAVRGSDQQKEPEFYESFWWSSIDDLVRLFEASGFKIVRRDAIAIPWVGQQICFVKT